MGKIKKVDDCIKDNGFKSLVYGESGVGKTLLCATMPKPLIISNEKGLMSLKKSNLVRVHGENKPFVDYEPDVWEVTRLSEIIEVYRFLQNSKEAEKYESVCLDSLTDLADMLLIEVLKLPEVKDPRQGFYDVQKKIEELAKDFRDLPRYHVLITCAAERLKDELSGAVRVSPMLTGQKLGQKAPYWFDSVFKLSVEGHGENAYRVLKTRPEPSFVAKDRSGCLEASEYPAIKPLIDKIRKS
jgi:hypothetical protein